MGSSSDFLQQANDVEWTANPNVVLVFNAAKVSKLLAETRTHLHQLIARKERNHSLMCRLGEEVERLSGGYSDFAFSQPGVG